MSCISDCCRFNCYRHSSTLKRFHLTGNILKYCLKAFLNAEHLQRKPLSSPKLTIAHLPNPGGRITKFLHQPGATIPFPQVADSAEGYHMLVTIHIHKHNNYNNLFKILWIYMQGEVALTAHCTFNSNFPRIWYIFTWQRMHSSLQNL